MAHSCGVVGELRPVVPVYRHAYSGKGVKLLDPVAASPLSIVIEMNQFPFDVGVASRVGEAQMPQLLNRLKW